MTAFSKKYNHVLPLFCDWKNKNNEDTHTLKKIKINISHG
jgi:hypothetical protein